MLRWLIVSIIVVGISTSCGKVQKGNSRKPGSHRPSHTSGGSPPRGNIAPSNIANVAKKDGPLLKSVLNEITEISVSFGKEVMKSGRLKDVAVIKEILSKVNPDQLPKANRKPCLFIMQLQLYDAKRKNIGFIAICASSSPNGPGAFISKSPVKEWELVIPDANALVELVKGHLKKAGK